MTADGADASRLVGDGCTAPTGASIIPFPGQAAVPKRRVEIVTSPIEGEYQVGIGWEDGRWIMCGACTSLTDAMLLAVNRSDALGRIPIWDFSGLDGDVG